MFIDDFNGTILVIDFGNSAVKFGIFDHITGDSQGYFRVLTKTLRKASYVKVGVKYARHFLEGAKSKKFPNVRKVVYTSVNPEFSNPFLDGFRSVSGSKISFIEINHSNSFSFSSAVDSIDEVGIDLLCACETVAYRKRKLPTFILDLGTYSKLIFMNYYDDSYVLEGVNIGPGVWKMRDAGALPKHISPGDHEYNFFRVSENLIGKNTPNSFENGNGMMFANMFTSTIEQISVNLLEPNEENNYHIDVIVCGGGANLMEEALEASARFFLDYDLYFEEHLTMVGIYLVYMNNFLIVNGDA